MHHRFAVIFGPPSTYKTWHGKHFCTVNTPSEQNSQTEALDFYQLTLFSMIQKNKFMHKTLNMFVDSCLCQNNFMFANKQSYSLDLKFQTKITLLCYKCGILTSLSGNELYFPEEVEISFFPT